MSQSEGQFENGGSQEGIAGFQNVQKEDSKAYLNNYRAHSKGISHEEMVQAYNVWADKYDNDLCDGRYNGPSIAADAVSALFPPADRASVHILDVAAGTGRVGFQLYQRGFRKLDALEPSEGMLKMLTGREIYQNKFQTALGFNKTEGLSPGVYDVLVIAGGMGEGHIPVRAIREMIRVVKPGGKVVIVMREEYLSYVEEYAGKLEPYMNEQEEKGAWKKVSRTIVPEYSFNKDGVVYVYEVLPLAQNGDAKGTNST